VHQTLAQNADLPGKEAVEAPHSVNPRFKIVPKMLFSHAPPPLVFAIVYNLLALVNYIG
jgi:hypothetical protein